MIPGTADAIETPDRLDDATLVARAGDGDIGALEQLFRRYQTPMYRLAQRILDDPGDAEDAVQEAFLSAWRRLGTFRGDAAFSSWLYRIVTNRCLNMTRFRQRTAVPLDHAEAVVIATAQDDPAQRAAARHQRDALENALRELPRDQRVCWVLREGEGLGYEDISGITGLTPDAVRSKIYRARQGLAERMRSWR
jgi:RNA polymerase sigma-70 factor (ECF subfamily)